MQNVFTKSMRRQPVRTVALALLIAASSFAFATRAAEYAIITGKIGKLGGYYRSVGVLSSSQGYISDVSAGADAVRDSPFEVTEDRRRAAAGILKGMTNSDIMGFSERGISTYMLNRTAFRGIPDAFFYGRLLSKEFVPEDMSLTVPTHVKLVFAVDCVLTGYPENVIEGQELEVRYYPTQGEYLGLLQAERLSEETGAVVHPELEIDGMVVGQRYLARAMLLRGYTPNGFPKPGGSSYENVLTMRAVNERTEGYVRSAPEENLWCIPVGPDESLDLEDPSLVWLGNEVDRAWQSQHELQIRSSRDMTRYPYAFGRDRMIFLRSGRFIDAADDENANMVCMVNEFFAGTRGLGLGDRITVSVPREQDAINSIFSMMQYKDNITRSHLELEIASKQDASDDCELELEIVGTFCIHPPYIATELFLGLGTGNSNFVYIPDSILPNGINAKVGAVRDLPELGRSADPLPDIWYSFELGDIGDKDAMREYLAENAPDYRLAFAENGDVDGFLTSSEPIMRSVALGAAVFAAAMALVQASAVFLHIRQRRRDFAIVRALGCGSGAALGQLTRSFVVSGVPAVATGCAAGWWYSLSRADEMFKSFAELEKELGVTLDAPPPVLLLPVIFAVAVALMALMIFTGMRILAHRPILDILRGEGAAAAGKTFIGTVDEETAKSNAAAAAGDEAADTLVYPKGSPEGGTSRILPMPRQRKINVGGDGASSRIGESGTAQHREPAGQSMSSVMRFIWRCVTRAPQRSVIALAVALLFVFALGWLRSTIALTEAEIDRMYDSVAVECSVSTDDFISESRSPIDERVVSEILATGYTRNEFYVAWHTESFIVAAGEDGSFPEDWQPVESGESYVPGAALNWGDQILAPNDISRFAADNSASSYYGDLFFNPNFEDGSLIGEFSIRYAEGYDPEDFAVVPGVPIPAVLPGDLMQERGLSLGDNAYIAYSRIVNLVTGEMAPWDSMPIVVVGEHNGNIIGNGLRRAVVVPASAVYDMLGAFTRYVRFSFEIDPVRARELVPVKGELTRIVDRASGGYHLWLVVYDEELRVVVGTMEENLSLLRTLYPIASTASVVVGAALGFLMLMQIARNAAIMRALGATKARTALTLFAGQAVLCLLGLALGAAASGLIGWGVMKAAASAALYLTGSVAGAAAGSAVVAGRSPLALLQVKE